VVISRLGLNNKGGCQ